MPIIQSNTKQADFQWLDGGMWLEGRKKTLGKAVESPLTYRKPRRMMLASDIFHEGVPDGYIDQVFAVMALCWWHTFLILTKRAGRQREYLSDQGLPKRLWAELGRIYQVEKMSPGSRKMWESDEGQRMPLPNVQLGVSVEDQATADERVPLLLRTPAAFRFVSCEPMLTGVDLSPYLKGTSHESSRNRISGIGRAGDVHDRQPRSDLEAQGVDERQSFGIGTSVDSLAKDSAGGRERVGATERSQDELSAGDVYGERKTLEGSSPPHGLDDPQRGADSHGSGNQPHERARGRQQPGKSGSGDNLAEHNPCNPCAGGKAKSSIRVAEPLNQSHGGAGRGDQKTGRAEVYAAQEDSRDVRGKAANGFQHPHRENLEARGLDLVICGGESGPNARPAHPDWFRLTRNQCAEAGVAFFFKQNGEWAPSMDFPATTARHTHISVSGRSFEDGRESRTEDGVVYGMARVGKKTAGRLLDGRTHDDLGSGVSASTTREL